tara:strand:+ start:82 stop:339 length:258 start_codon:yes stop_codon:yes gene_type:complete
MATEIDATIRLGMDQGYTDNLQALRLLGTQAIQQSNFVNQQVQLSHSRVIGAFEAKALGNLEEEGIADAVLQNNSARDQPGQNKP